MIKAALAKWQVVRNAALKKQISSSDRTGGFTAFSKSFRFFLQSAMLALGAYLTLLGEVTGGAMIASSIMLGRALAPVEQIIGQWPLVLRMKQGWKSLEALLSEVPPGTKSIVLQKLSFELKPGEVLGVLGLSASGKSSLARILTGIWKAV
ncbi:MAG: ATP-binding cassette domain-containing protein [Rhodobacteraceae bacterium]|nr:ATP-binding cassette domain-containing protein [Paracoccaceae bacterium]